MDKELLYRFFRCEATAAEEDKVLNWIDLSPDNRSRFEEERTKYYKLYLNAPGVIESRYRFTGKRGGTVKKLVAFAAGVAAIAAVILVCSAIVRSNVTREFESRKMEVIVPAGQRMQLRLSDGTMVTLNSGTVLEYPAVFGSNRRVRLQGEGLFEVEHDPDSPFIVETYACDLEVLGTKFNVVSDETEEEFSATLFEGRLKLSNFLYGDIEYIMSPTERLSLNGKALVLDRIEDENDLLWIQGLLSLENTTFEQLMKKFEKYYDVTIVMERETPPSLYITRGKVKVSEGIDHALTVLQSSANFTYTKENENRLIIIK